MNTLMDLPVDKHSSHFEYQGFAASLLNEQLDKAWNEIFSLDGLGFTDQISEFFYVVKEPDFKKCWFKLFISLIASVTGTVALFKKNTKTCAKITFVGPDTSTKRAIDVFADLIPTFIQLDDSYQRFQTESEGSLDTNIHKYAVPNWLITKYSYVDLPIVNKNKLKAYLEEHSLSADQISFQKEAVTVLTDIGKEINNSIDYEQSSFRGYPHVLEPLRLYANSKRRSLSAQLNIVIDNYLNTEDAFLVDKECSPHNSFLMSSLVPTSFRTTKLKREAIRYAADSSGMSLTQWVNHAIYFCLSKKVLEPSNSDN